MILVTVGTENYPFDRLLRAADELHEVLDGEEVFMQIGACTYQPQTSHERFLSHQDFQDKLNAARIVIGHAGTGTLVACANLNKIPILMARRSCYGEHIDDHQLMLTERASESGRFLAASNALELRQYVLRYDSLVRGLAVAKPDQLSLVSHLKSRLKDFDI